MRGDHIIPAHAVATLVLINQALTDIIIYEGTTPDILEELDELQERLQTIIGGLKEKSPSRCPSTKSAV